METIENYIGDTIIQLLEEAIELKKVSDNEFNKGKLFGYYEVISRLLNQAEAFGISEKLPKRIHEYNLESLIN